MDYSAVHYMYCFLISVCLPYRGLPAWPIVVVFFIASDERGIQINIFLISPQNMLWVIISSPEALLQVSYAMACCPSSVVSFSYF